MIIEQKFQYNPGTASLSVKNKMETKLRIL